MKSTPRLPISLLCFVLSLSGLSLSIAAPPAVAVPFRASYEVDLQAEINLPIATVTSTGSALATHLGRVAARSVEETVNLATGEGVATHEFIAANGDTLVVDFVFTAIPTSETNFDVNGTWQIAGGTGRFENTAGSGSYSGLVQFTGPTTATGHFEMEGTSSLPGGWN
jgi:hypothetical protein